MLIPIIGVTLFLRLHTISPFKIYPDAYQNLLVARTIFDYQSVVGFLGTQGMLYPDIFMWTRPIYALFILAGTVLGVDISMSAQMLAFIFGILAIPLAYLFLRKLFYSELAGIAGALLLGLSYNHAVWSGFIMTETTGVFFMLLFLYLLITTIQSKQYKLMSALTGMVFAVAVLTRYEYVIIAIPTVLLLATQLKEPKRALGLFSLTALCIFLLVGFHLYPMHSLFSIIWIQFQELLIYGGLILGISILIFIAIHVFPHSKQRLAHILRPIALTTLWLFSALLLFQILFLNADSWVSQQLSFVRNFVQHDFFISMFALIGYTSLLRNHKQHMFGYISLVSVVLLGCIYYQINPDMERYTTHLLPFLLIPASYGVMIIFQHNKKPFVPALFGILLILQGFISHQGLHVLMQPSWFQTSYEELSAQKLKLYLKDPNTVIIASMPEPYYLETRHTVHSLTPQYPFLYIPSSLDDHTVIVVEDMGMHEYFPEFVAFLHEELRDKRVARYTIGQSFHSTNIVKKEQYPVILYQLRLKDMRKKIEVYKD